MLYDDLMNLLRSRKTQRLVDESDISQDNINKIINAALLAPSLDKVYPYTIVALTNGPNSMALKKHLIEHARCGPDKDGDPWQDREINQSFLSGLVLVFISGPNTGVQEPNPTPVDLSHRTQHLKDAMISATYAMMAAESLGLSTSYIGGFRDAAAAVAKFTPNLEARIAVTITCSNRDLLKGKVAADYHHTDKIGNPYEYYTYANQQARILGLKHHNITRAPVVQFVH
jgi:hypothetical protein